MPLRILTAQQVRRLLSMPDCIEVLAQAMRAASAGEVITPQRLVVPLQGESGWFLLMPGSATEPACYGAKIVSLHAQNPARGLPAIQGLVVLFDHDSGSPLTVMEGGELTAIRTAAASALAARELARPDARSHGILGSGALARTHIEAMFAVRPIEEVLVWGRNPDKARELVASLDDPRVQATDRPELAAACDIVSTVTGASEPVLFGDWLQAGSHVNLVGAHSPVTREADEHAIARCDIYVDSLESARHEAGDLLIAIEKGALAETDIVGEIGEVLSGRKPGRRDARQITLYKSLGIVAQDLFAAELVHRRACEEGVGSVVDL